jgi:hypothetical protein
MQRPRPRPCLAPSNQPDFASDLDKGRSICGYIFSLCDSAVSCKTSLQFVTALSTTEAGYVLATKEVK